MVSYSGENNQMEIWRNQVLEMLCQQDISGAVKKLKEAFYIMPHDIQTLNLMGNCCYILGEFEKAESYWHEVLQYEPNNKIARSKLRNFKAPAFKFWLKRYYNALALIQNREYEKAKEILHELLQENDSFISVYKFLGLCYKELGEGTDALKVWRQGLKLDKNNEELQGYIADTVNKNKLPFELKPDVEGEIVFKGLKLPFKFNKNKITWAVAGIASLALTVQIVSSLGNNDLPAHDAKTVSAVTELKDNKITDGKKTVPVLNSTGGLLADTYGEEMTAEGSDYDESREMSYYTEGYKAYKKGNLKAAITNLSVVVSMHSGSYINREALYYLARTYYVQNDYDNAEKYYLEYLRLFPDSNYYDESLYYLASLYYKKGEAEKARDMFLQLKNLYPQSGYITTDLYKSVMKN